MEKFKISKEKLLKIKDIVIFILLFLWMIMPIFQSIYSMNIMNSEYFFLMKMIAVFGIGTAIINIYYKFRKAKNKKEIIKKMIPIFLFVIYMIWTLISAHKATRTYQAFYGNSYRNEGYFMYINYAGFFFCAMLLESKKLRKILLNTFLITSIFIIGTEHLPKGTFEKVFENSNHYGYYFLMSLTCALGLFISEKNKILKIIYLIAYTIIAFGSIFNNTFGCYLAMIVTLVLYTIYAIIKKTDRKLIFIAIAIFLLLSVTTNLKNGKNLTEQNIKQLGEDIQVINSKIMNKETEIIDEKEVNVEKQFNNTGSGRMKLWTKAIEFIEAKPIIGYGPDNLKDKYLRLGIDADRPHNLLIYLACVSGIPGMLIYVIAVAIIVINGIIYLFKNNKNGLIYLIVVVTYLGSSMFGNSMYYTSPYFFIFLGSLMHYNLKEQEE